MLLLMNYQCSVLLYYLGPLGRMVQSVPKELPHCNNFSVYVIIIVIKVSIYLSIYLHGIAGDYSKFFCLINVAYRAMAHFYG